MNGNGEHRMRIAMGAYPPAAPVQNPSYRNLSVEECAHEYEKMAQLRKRNRTLRNVADVIIWLLLLAGIVGGGFAWTNHKSRMEAERLRLEKAREEERIRMERERNRLEAERRERLRLEREAEAERRERVARQREEERRRAETELRNNRERYQLFLQAIRCNEFDLFTKSVTNSLESTGGELCYMLPSSTYPVPLYWTVYDTNGAVRVSRIGSNGETEEIDADMFATMSAATDFVVAKGDKVYFRANGRKPMTGLLGKNGNGNPATVFFGALADTMDSVKPLYDELVFDVFFTARDSGKRIKCETVELGCRYSIERMREAVENAFPPADVSNAQSSRSRKFKRTVQFWDGAMIKRGIDGVTYVPRTRPVAPVWDEPRRFRSNLSGHDIIYRSRKPYANYANEAARWDDLAERARREDEEEAAYYERQRQRRADGRKARMSKAQTEWEAKIDRIIASGTLSFKIRKRSAAKKK